MQGSLALNRGVLAIGNQEKTARVRFFDLDGRLRSPGFTFRDDRAGRSVVAGLAMDEDRQVWVADTPSSRVRIFTVFGREVGGVGLPTDQALEDAAQEDAWNRVRAPVDVAVEGHVDEGRVVVACGGTRRHAVQLFDHSLGFAGSLRPRGDSRGVFRAVRRVALFERYVLGR